MAMSMTFGDILKEARQRKGIDITTAARRLHIRTDIIRAIENTDFERMPPRGYTKNMINAYARLLGLNGSDLTRMYLDDAYAFEVERARGGSSRGSRFSQSMDTRSSISRDAVPTANGRLTYDDRTDGYGRTYAQDRVHPSRSASAPTTQYTNFYAGPRGGMVNQSGLTSKLPFIIGGAVIIVILIIVLVIAFGNRPAVDDDLPSTPITGLTDTSGNTSTNTNDASSSNTTTTPPAAIAPTAAVFTYAVSSGQSAYIEIYLDDSNSPTLAETVSGPAQETINVTGTLRFVTSQPEAVAITVDGSPIDITDASVDGVSVNQNAGVYTYNVDFSKILAQWNAQNGVSGTSGNNISSGTTTGNGVSGTNGATGSTGSTDTNNTSTGATNTSGGSGSTSTNGGAGNTNTGGITSQ